MPTPVNIPKLGISMTEGTLNTWMVGDGDTVEKGQVLYVLETDKVETEIESPAAGTVRLVAEPGEVYPVGALVAQIE
ncbi:MAG TPA: biotin/lipoyl-containing protein [Acidimicrobiia bacterium]|jgi:pyruvate/2-oxoglutarate dehydrogenase complex dihydrolipoamide acyltransferase (E2) component